MHSADEDNAQDMTMTRQYDSHRQDMSVKGVILNSNL